MAEPDSTIRSVQTAPASEKTFTRHLLDTLRSHPSCMDARRFPTFHGAADVSGR
jgi:hypothetical protein